MANDKTAMEKLGIYEIECDGPNEEGWLHIKMKVSLKFWLKMMFHKYFSFYFKKQ